MHISFVETYLQLLASKFEYIENDYAVIIQNRKLGNL